MLIAGTSSLFRCNPERKSDHRQGGTWLHSRAGHISLEGMGCAGCQYGKVYHYILYHCLGDDTEFFFMLVLSLPGVVVPVFAQGLADSPAFFTLRYSFSKGLISLQ